MAEAMEPITQDITRGALQPLAKGLAENAVPVTNEFADKTLLPAADMIAEQVSLHGPRPRARHAVAVAVLCGAPNKH